MMRHEIAPLLAIIGVAMFGFIFGLGVGFGLGNAQPVNAAPPDVPSCEAINQAGAITVYRCEPEYGLPYLINSMGFMVVED